VRPCLDRRRYTSWPLGKRRGGTGLLGSRGSAGDAYENVTCESFSYTVQRLHVRSRQLWEPEGHRSGDLITPIQPSAKRGKFTVPLVGPTRS
jgi:hypothetical protein